MTNVIRLSPQSIAKATEAEKAARRFKARLWRQNGLSFGEIAQRLNVSRSEAHRLVNRVPKAGPLPLKTMTRRAA